MMENDVEEYLKKNGITEKDLDEKSRKALNVFRGLKTLAEKNPSIAVMKENAEKNGEDVIRLITGELKEKGSSPETRANAAKAFNSMRKKSLKQVKKTDKVVDELEFCIKKVNAHKKKQRELNPPKPRKKKSTVTKVKEAFTRILKLMPVEDKAVVEESEQILRKCASALFKINKLTKLKLVHTELKEVANKKSPDVKKKDAA